MLLKQYGEAIKEFNESISIYNGNFENYYNIGNTYLLVFSKMLTILRKI